MSLTTIPVVSQSDAPGGFVRPAVAVAFDNANSMGLTNTGLESLVVVSSGTNTITFTRIGGATDVVTLASGKSYVFQPLPVQIYGSGVLTITPSGTAGTIYAVASKVRAAGALDSGRAGIGGTVTA